MKAIPRLMMFVLACSVIAPTLPAGATGVEFHQSENEAMRKLPFSESVRAGELLFLSGQVGTDPETGELVEGGIRPEARQTLENIQAALARRDLGMADVVKCTVMLADISEWAAFNDVYRTFFDAPYPARSAFAASGLALDARVEVECIAASPGGGS